MKLIRTTENPSSLLCLSLFLSFSFLPLFPSVVCKGDSVFRFAATFCVATTFVFAVVVVVASCGFLVGVTCVDDCVFILGVGDDKSLSD